ncbi:MAG: C/D box methylation guide ribonucleoprotein complex aNOP56 subunit, partial [Candidatus Bathyarchaeota archaeon]
VHLIASLGSRHNFTVENITKIGLSAQRTENISEAAENSMGADLGEKGIEEVRGFSEALLQLYSLRDKMESYLDILMSEAAPNIRELVGSTLGARLIAATGNLENLSKKSSGTIQVLGAEKALFRSLKTGTRPPKHGLIFQYKDIHQSPRWQRGKISRALAGKLAIAARLDAYGGEYQGDRLKAVFDKRVEEIKASYAEPPKKGKR